MIQNHIKGITKNEADKKANELLSDRNQKLITLLIKNRNKKEDIVNILFEHFDPKLHAHSAFDLAQILLYLVRCQKWNIISMYSDYLDELDKENIGFSKNLYRVVIPKLNFTYDEENIVKFLLKI